jgi:diguanylate cyclase (GGDEF)-like protein
MVHQFSNDNIKMKTIITVSEDTLLTNIIIKNLKPLYNVIVFSGVASALDSIYNSIPDLVIVEINLSNTKAIDILSNLKRDPMFSQLPILAILPDNTDVLEWNTFFVEDYIRMQDLGREISPRVELCIIRSERVVEINPLTRLPGNISINKQIQSRLDANEVFALAYLDIDHFKPFNDKYGFSRGDEVIKVVGRLILNIVKNKQIQYSFVGHIGGDDFIYIMDTDVIEETSAEIIDAFNRIIQTFYDPEDREKGYIQSRDRQGNIKTFSFMTVSIGITNNQNRHFVHYGEITEIASKMKTQAKRSKGGSFKRDMRNIS